MNKQFIYNIDPHDEGSFTASKNWRMNVAPKYACSDCRYIGPEMGAIDAEVIKTQRTSDLDFLYPYPILIANVRLLEAIGSKHVDRCMQVGRVSDNTGKELAYYRTLLGHQRIYIRGERCQWHICPECNHLSYRPLGKLYILPPIEPAMLYQNQDYSLLVEASLFERRLLGTKWRKVKIQELPILDEPLDGLPFDLDELKLGRIKRGTERNRK